MPPAPPGRCQLDRAAPAGRSAPRLSCRLDDRAGRASNSSSAAAIKRPPTTRRRVTSMSRAGVGAAPSSYAMYHQVHQQSFQVSPRRSSAAVRLSPQPSPPPAAAAHVYTYSDATPALDLRGEPRAVAARHINK